MFIVEQIWCRMVCVIYSLSFNKLFLKSSRSFQITSNNGHIAFIISGILMVLHANSAHSNRLSVFLSTYVMLMLVLVLVVYRVCVLRSGCKGVEVLVADSGCVGFVTCRSDDGVSDVLFSDVFVEGTKFAGGTVWAAGLFRTDD